MHLVKTFVLTLGRPIAAESTHGALQRAEAAGDFSRAMCGFHEEQRKNTARRAMPWFRKGMQLNGCTEWKAAAMAAARSAFADAPKKLDQLRTRGGMILREHTTRRARAIMSRLATGVLLRQIHRLVQGNTPVPGTDAELLYRYAASRDEAAFAALVHRHGPMVWNACRRALRHHQDAEDVYQATFIVLARKAATVQWRPSVRPVAVRRGPAIGVQSPLGSDPSAQRHDRRAGCPGPVGGNERPRIVDSGGRRSDGLARALSRAGHPVLAGRANPGRGGPPVANLAQHAAPPSRTGQALAESAAGAARLDAGGSAGRAGAVPGTHAGDAATAAGRRAAERRYPPSVRLRSPRHSWATPRPKPR